MVDTGRDRHTILQVMPHPEPHLLRTIRQIAVDVRRAQVVDRAVTRPTRSGGDWLPVSTVTDCQMATE
jgi:hypothetical protein